MHVGDILRRVGGYHAYIRAPWCKWENEGGLLPKKVGTDVRARAFGILGVNFCPGSRFWEVNFAKALGFWQFLTKMCNI